MALSLRRAGALLAAAFVTAPLVAASPAFAEEQQETLTLFNINDFHGRINASAKDLACTLEEERAKVDGPSFFLSAGDNVGASEFESFIQQDQPTIDYLNALGLEASAVGNHEFDQGLEDLTGRIAKNSNFEILGANVYKDGKRALPAYSIEEHDGFKVAVIGVVTEQTRDLVSPAGIEGVEFTDAVDEVNKVVEEMEAEGVEYDFLVAEYHAGGAKSAKAGSTIDDALLARLAEDTSPKVNAIFTGHTHKSYLYVHNGRSIIQTGEYGQNLGAVSFTKDAEGIGAPGSRHSYPPKVSLRGKAARTTRGTSRLRRSPMLRLRRATSSARRRSARSRVTLRPRGTAQRPSTRTIRGAARPVMRARRAMTVRRVPQSPISPLNPRCGR